MTEPGAENKHRQSIHREQKCDQNLAFSLLGSAFSLGPTEGTLGLNITVFIYMDHIYMLSGTAMISCKMIQYKSRMRKCIFWKCVVFLNYSKWQGSDFGKYIAPCIRGDQYLHCKENGLGVKSFMSEIPSLRAALWSRYLPSQQLIWGNLLHSTQPVGCALGILDQDLVAPQAQTDGLPLGVHSAVPGHVNTLSQFRVEKLGAREFQICSNSFPYRNVNITDIYGYKYFWADLNITEPYIYLVLHENNSPSFYKTQPLISHISTSHSIMIFAIFPKVVIFSFMLAHFKTKNLLQPYYKNSIHKNYSHLLDIFF